MAVLLSGAERAQCLQASDFDVSFRVVGPVADTLSAASGGELRVTSFSSVFTRSTSNTRSPVVDASTDAGITVDTANSLTAINGTGCTFAMTTGDLVFDVDFNLIAADPASAIFDVTITGI